MGLLTAFKAFLRSIIAPGLYVGGVILMYITILYRVEIGMFLLTFLIPQPNVWYKLHAYPFGKDFMDLLYLSVILGCAYQKRTAITGRNSLLIFVFLLVAYASLWNSSVRFSLPIPLTTANVLLFDFKNYAQMVGLYFLVLMVADTEERRRQVVLVLAVAFLLIAVRSYRNFSGGTEFSYGKRYGGPFEAVNLGANHLGAFAAAYVALLFGLFLMEHNALRKGIFLAAALFGLHPLFFSYSRGAYLAALSALMFLSLFRKRLLLVVALIIVGWQTLLPVSVVDRITMTRSEDGQLEHSAEGRLALWGLALDMFRENPLFGRGFGGYQMSVGGSVAYTGEQVRDGGVDVHSYYMRTLSEQGMVGIALLLLVLGRAFQSGWRLYSGSREPQHRGLALGFMSCVIATAVTNMFGDRWSYYVLGGYFWIAFGLVEGTLRALRAGASGPEATGVGPSRV